MLICEYIVYDCSCVTKAELNSCERDLKYLQQWPHGPQWLEYLPSGPSHKSLPLSALLHQSKDIVIITSLGFPGGTSGKKKTTHLPMQVTEETYIGSSPRSGRFPWRRKWQPISVFLPRESCGQEEPGGLSSIGLQRVRQDWSDLACVQRHEIVFIHLFICYFGCAGSSLWHVGSWVDLL